MSILMSIYQSVCLSISLPEFSMSGELHDNPDRWNLFPWVWWGWSNRLSISLPEFSMSGKLHDNPDRITGADSHKFDDVRMIKLLHDDGLLQKLLCRAWLSLNLIELFVSNKTNTSKYTLKVSYYIFNVCSTIHNLFICYFGVDF